MDEDMIETQSYLASSLFDQQIDSDVEVNAAIPQILENALERSMTSGNSSIEVLAPSLETKLNCERKKVHPSILEEKKECPVPIKLNEEKTLQDRLGDIFPDLTEKYELVSSILETENILKSLLKADSSFSYLVNPTNTNELFQVYRDASCKVIWTTTPSLMMAAYTVLKKKFVVSKNVLADERFPGGLGYKCTTPKFGLCVPIITREKEVLGVYEFSKNIDQIPFGPRDIQIALAVTGWMGVAIKQNSLYSSMTRQKELTDHLVQITNCNFGDQSDKGHIISNLVILAKNVIGADSCKLYMIVKRIDDRLFIEVYEQGFGNNDNCLYKKRGEKKLEPDSSPLARVLFQGEIVNEQNFEVNESEISLLCVPILCNNTVTGAIELVNDNSTRFDIEDEEAMREVSKICSINVTHKNIYDKIKASEVENKIISELLYHQIKPCIHDDEKYCKKKPSKGNELPDNFFTYPWYPSPDEMPRLTELTICMFHEVLGDSFMSRNNTPMFVLMVQNCYRPNPYHNFLHAFVVTHTMSNIIRHHHTMFTRLELKGLMIAALCHDLDHRGYTNNFIQLTKHYLSKLYESSPLENHHFAVTKMIMEQCGMFKYMKSEIYNQLLVEIYQLIISTDLSIYFQSRMELMKIADEKSFSFKEPSHRRLVKSMVMTACDLSGQTKALPISQKFTEDVYEEFFLQGDAEKAFGLVPLPAMDRSMKHKICENQVHFLSTIVIPCIEIVSRFFSSLTLVLSNTKSLLKEWEELLKLKNEDSCSTEDSVPYLDLV